MPLPEHVFDSVKSTISKMMDSRKYSRDESREFKKDEMLIKSVFKSNITQENVFVVIVRPNRDGRSQENVELFRSIAQETEKEEISDVVIVTENGFTSSVQKSIEDIKNKIHVQQFYFHELISPIIEHSFMPKFKKIGPRETEQLFKKYSIRDIDDAKYILRPILEDDIVIRYMNFKKNTIIFVQNKYHIVV